jgi:hypothetical protein
MAGILNALLQNESGGRNIANTTQGTSSGQAQGYFQITTGTWDEFGGRQYAPDPLHASYEQQAQIASKIPVKRWDESTVALMRGTGKPIDVNKTLGENLSANGENILQTTGATSTSSAPAYTTLTPPPAADAASAFAYLNNNNLYEEAEAATPPPQYSPLADTLASSVDNASPQRQGSEPIGYNDLLGVPEGGAGDTLPPSALASQPGPEGQAPPAINPSTDESLADLFKVKPVGQAAMLDPKTGRPLLNRFRALG